MDMTIRQLSDLVAGNVVKEQEYSSENPQDIVGVLRLVLHNCSDFLRSEGIEPVQDSIELRKLTMTYPGLAGILEIIFGEEGEA